MRLNKNPNNNAVLVSTQELGPIIKSFVSDNKQVIITATGDSMRPFLRDGEDKVVLCRLKTSPKKNDVLFYLRDDGTYVLHRVFKVKNGGYVMLGDAQLIPEYGITDKHIIAVASAFIKNGKQIGCNSFSYLTRVRLWRMLYPFRILKAKAVYALKRIIK